MAKNKIHDYLVIGGGVKPRIGFLKRLAADSKHVVTVDRGAETALRMGVDPLLHVGDDDSISRTALKKLKRRLKQNPRAQIVKLQKEKSLSDLEFTLNVLPKKASKVVVGCHRDDEGRTDHVFINLMLAAKTRNTIFADERMWFKNISNDSFTLKARPGTIFTLASFGNPRVTIKGAQYDIKNTRLKNISEGLSNVVKNRSVSIKARGPALLFVWADLLKS